LTWYFAKLVGADFVRCLIKGHGMQLLKKFLTFINYPTHPLSTINGLHPAQLRRKTTVTSQLIVLLFKFLL
jgi:hypothetical protein